MAQENSFDVVNHVDIQEIKNAINLANKEVSTRYDFKKSISHINLEKETIVLNSDDEFRLKSLTDVLETKLVKRNVPLKALQRGKIERALGNTVRQRIEIIQGIPEEKAREINKFLKSKKLKIKIQIQPEQIRVSSKSRDLLQEAMAQIKSKDFDIPLQFVNFRSI